MARLTKKVNIYLQIVSNAPDYMSLPRANPSYPMYYQVVTDFSSFGWLLARFPDVRWL